MANTCSDLRVALVLQHCTIDSSLPDTSQSEVVGRRERIEHPYYTFAKKHMVFTQIVLRTFTAKDWIENFHVSKETFTYICDSLKPFIKQQDTKFRKAICTEHRVAITLWCLATCAIVTTLMSQYITFPKGDDLKEVITGFRQKWGFVQCAGAIDSTHIPVRAPAMSHTDYYNRKGWYSIIVQGVVDHNYLFRNVYCGWPGSVHDARVLANSALYRKATSGELLQGNTLTVLSQEIPVFLVGDSAYPLSTWLMKPFPHNTALSTAQRNFNYRLSRARIVSENAFGRLKARWRRLQKQNDMAINNIPNVIIACCILHNVCEIH
ncbi:uncharacterized protein [Dysidea avara]|uniref:uncharacterized protein n=1 Tax=Dysidea avara TaxID=196820 RepID=UPI00331818DA